MRVVLMMPVLAGTSVLADTEIHRCLLEDGTVAFQEMPCPEPVMPADDADAPDARRRIPDAADDDDVDDPVNPPDDPAGQPANSGPAGPGALSRNRRACEKTTRDAIDAIDRKMRDNDTSEQRREYLADLLALTEQLRACKRL